MNPGTKRQELMLQSLPWPTCAARGNFWRLCGCVAAEGGPSSSDDSEVALDEGPPAARPLPVTAERSLGTCDRCDLFRAVHYINGNDARVRLSNLYWEGKLTHLQGC